ncbi:MAG: CYTH domain-containing protein [Verrucomicrobiota bacterium]|nr:CYTH domain-containing protein [Verrucomicrobiota bacterium]
MKIEIERKFLLKNDAWRSEVTSQSNYVQGYVASGNKAVVRIRTVDDRAYITFKSSKSGMSRLEYELEIPFDDAQKMLKEFCESRIEKIRYILKRDNFIWEIDEFYGENRGLVTAEIELSHEKDSFAIPQWLGKEITDIPQYYNFALSLDPYSLWDKKHL